MTQSYGMSSSISEGIMKGRSRMSYMAIADARGLNNTVSSVRTPQEALDLRERIIHSTMGSRLESCITRSGCALVYTGPTVFRSL